MSLEFDIFNRCCILCTRHGADVCILQVATYIMLIGQPFALAAGVAVVWTRLFYAERIARRFKDAKAAGVLRVRHRFRDAHEVEICAR